MAEPLTGQTHRRRVDDWQHVFEIVRDEPEKECLVAVLKRDQPDVPFKRIGLAHDVGIGTANLLLDGADL